MTILKSLVACLALANLLYFLWTHGIAASGDQAAAPVAPPRTLKLVSESPAPARAAPDAAAPASVAPPSAVPDGSGPPAPENAGDVAASGATAGLPAGARHCMTVGPFRDAGQAGHAAVALRAGGLDPRQHAVGKVYWIDVDIKAGDGFPSPAELEGGAPRSSPLEVKACPAEIAPPGAGAAL
jgi:hypothetical protein